MQVYACVYLSKGDGKGNFIIAIKPQCGYFFGSNGGKVLPNGQKLHGGGDYALPGGKTSGAETVIQCAMREWREETNNTLTDDGAQEHCFKDGLYKYGAGYFPIDNKEAFNARVKFISDDALVQAAQAVQSIKNHSITCYKQVKGQFPKAPEDNEIASVLVWNVNTDWGRIKDFKGRDDVGWFYVILKHLKKEIINKEGARL